MPNTCFCASSVGAGWPGRNGTRKFGCGRASRKAGRSSYLDRLMRDDSVLDPSDHPAFLDRRIQLPCPIRPLPLPQAMHKSSGGLSDDAEIAGRAGVSNRRSHASSWSHSAPRECRHSPAGGAAHAYAMAGENHFGINAHTPIVGDILARWQNFPALQLNLCGTRGERIEAVLPQRGSTVPPAA